MIIHVSPDAPLLIRAAAEAALVLHIGGGTLGVLSGGAALALRKGDRRHRAIGDAFVISMLIAMSIAAVTAPFVPQMSNLPGAVFTAYLVATAFATVRRRPDTVGVFEVGAFLVAVAAATGMAWFAWVGAHSPHGLIEGVPYQAALIVCALSSFAAALDLRMILRGGLSGVARITRHVWRMGTALFFAAASFFIGQPQVFPEPLRGSPILMAPVLAILAAMIFWLVRLRLPRLFRAPSFERSPA